MWSIFDDICNWSNKKLFELYLNLADECYYDLKYKSAIEYYEKALSKLETNSDFVIKKENKLIAQCYNNLGNSYNKNGDLEKAIIYLSKAFDLWDKLYTDLNNENAAQCLINLGVVYYKKNDYNTAIQYHLYALNRDIINYDNYFQDLHALVVYNNMGQIYCSNHNYSKSIEYYLKTLAKGYDIFQDKEPIRIANIHCNLSKSYFENADYKLALDHVKKAQTIYRENSCSDKLNSIQAFLDKVQKKIHLEAEDICYWYDDICIEVTGCNIQE